MVIQIYSVTQGYTDNVDYKNIGSFRKQFFAYLDTNHPDIEAKITETGLLHGEETEDKLKQALKAFVESVYKV